MVSETVGSLRPHTASRAVGKAAGPIREAMRKPLLFAAAAASVAALALARRRRRLARARVRPAAPAGGSRGAARVALTAVPPHFRDPALPLPRRLWHALRVALASCRLASTRRARVALLLVGSRGDYQANARSLLSARKTRSLSHARGPARIDDASPRPTRRCAPRSSGAGSR